MSHPLSINHAWQMALGKIPPSGTSTKVVGSVFQYTRNFYYYNLARRVFRNGRWQWVSEKASIVRHVKRARTPQENMQTGIVYEGEIVVTYKLSHRGACHAPPCAFHLVVIHKEPLLPLAFKWTPDGYRLEHEGATLDVPSPHWRL